MDHNDKTASLAGLTVPVASKVVATSSYQISPEIATSEYAGASRPLSWLLGHLSICRGRTPVGASTILRERIGLNAKEAVVAIREANRIRWGIEPYREGAKS